MRLPLLMVLAAAVAAACGPRPKLPKQGDPWVAVPAANVRQTGRFDDPRLIESSGVAASRTYPGVLWTHNDAGHPAELFATDTLGRALGRWTVTGAGSSDWEDIALGPCPSGTCLYIGDVGDNAERRPHVTLYRIPEPDPTTGGGLTVPAETLQIRYPDQPRDVEALFVDRSGTTWLISKGRSSGILLYRIDTEAWQSGAVTAELVATLPIAHQLLTGRAVTGASLAPDGRRVVVRTYRDLFLLILESERSVIPAPPPNRCDILGLEPQGEAVDWWDDHTLVLTSEGRAGVVHLLQCGG